MPRHVTSNGLCNGFAMQSPRFSLQTMMVMLLTCCVAFSLISQLPGSSIAVAAAMVPTFWVGAATNVAGAALEGQGDDWLWGAVAMTVGGSLVCVVAIFTGVFYGLMSFLG